MGAAVVPPNLGIIGHWLVQRLLVNPEADFEEPEATTQSGAPASEVNQLGLKMNDCPSTAKISSTGKLFRRPRSGLKRFRLRKRWRDGV